MSKLNIKPLADRVLVEPLEAETKTASGIIIPDSATEKPSTGEVVAVSKEVSILENGNKVIFGKYSGNEVTIGVDKFLVLDTDDIFGIIG